MNASTYAESREAQYAWAEEQGERLIAGITVRLTPSQRESIMDLAHTVAQAALVGYGKEKEVKEFEVSHLRKDLHNGTIVVFIKAGAVNDENTIGSMTRPTQQFFIGRRGGISWYELRKRDGRRTKAYGRKRLYTAFGNSPFRLFF